MGDWGIVVGDCLAFEYCKGPTPVKDDEGNIKMEWVWTPREGVVEKSCGWGVVLEEDDPMDPNGNASRYRSYSIYNAEKCRNLVKG